MHFLQFFANSVDHLLLSNDWDKREDLLDGLVSKVHGACKGTTRLKYQPNFSLHAYRSAPCIGASFGYVYIIVPPTPFSIHCCYFPCRRIH
jgi:hypothetical protein